MSDPHASSWERAAAASGIAGALVFGVAMLVSGAPPAPDEPTANLVRHLAEHRTALLWQTALAVLAAPLLVWFFARLRGVLASAEGGSASLANAGFGGVLLLFATAGIGSLLLAAIVWRGPEVTAPELVRFAYDCDVLALYSMSSMFSLLSVVAPTIVGWRTRILPGWLVVVASALAVANALELLGLFSNTGPVAGGAMAGLIAIPAWLAWVAGASWSLLRRSARTP